ncbi:MAG: Murein hydrolase activator NlpD precursor, partial [Pseudomonadota bacterium]
MKLLSGRQSWMVISVLSVCLLAACTSRPRGPIPVEDRVAGQSTSRPVQRVQPQAASDSTRASAPVATSSPVSMGPAMTGSENAGKPGFYSVRPGDTLTKIALDHGQAWRDIAKWNGLDNPNMIEVHQVLRVAPPVMELAANRQIKPVMAQNPTPANTVTSNTPTPTASSAPASSASNAAPIAAAPVNVSDDGMTFAWPHPGPVLAGFDEAKNKGLDFAGKAGDPVLAAGDGKVVYAGSGLRGYGNLVILKHNNTYLTAYAHNQTLLVK